MKFIFIALWLLPFWSLSQEIPMKEGKVFYSDTNSVAGVSQNILYLRARKWIADTYAATKDDILMDDKDGGIIASKATFRMHIDNGIGDNDIKFVLTIKVKQGKYKYEMKSFLDDDLYVQKEYTLESYLKALVDPSKTVALINSKIAEISGSLKQAMTVKSDW